MHPGKTTSGSLRLLRFLIGFAFSGVSNASSKCPLPWNADPNLPDGMNTTAVCPYGHRMPGDVTFPNNPTMLDRIYVFYGYVPYAIIGLASLDTAVRCIVRAEKGIGTREFSFLFFVAFMVGLGELVWKKFAKESRPDHSCNLTCGMPSSHSTMSIGFFTLLFLDAVFRVMPSGPPNVASAHDFPRNPGINPKECVTLQLRALFNVIPMPDAHTLSRLDFIVFVFAWGVALLPVPLTRVMLNDHTLAQVAIGALIGFVEAVVYFMFLRLVFMNKWNARLGRRVGYIFHHNLAKPLFDVTSACYFLLATAQDQAQNQGVLADDEPLQGLLGDDEPLMQELAGMLHELNWYHEELDPTLQMFATGRDEAIACIRSEQIEDLKNQLITQLKTLNPDTALCEEASLVFESRAMSELSRGA